MHTKVKLFFDNFVNDFTSFNGKIIASRYLAPYLAVRSDGSLRTFIQNEEIESYFQSVLDGYSSQGVVACKYDEFESVLLSEYCILATVTWSMLSATGSTIVRWRESYNLIKSENDLKIFVSIDH